MRALGDLRFITPLHYHALVASVKKTGRLVLASDACERGSFLHTVASTASQLAFDWLDAPVSEGCRLRRDHHGIGWA